MGFSLKKIGRSLKKGVKSVGKEISRNKNTIASALLAPVTGGTSFALTSKDDTSLGRFVDKGLHWIDDNKATVAGLTAGALTGGLGTTLVAGMAGKTMVDDPAKERYQQKVAEAKANNISREAALVSKQSMLANELSMTARRAMSKRAQSNLRKNTATPASQFLGGEQQTLG